MDENRAEFQPSNPGAEEPKPERKKLAGPKIGPRYEVGPDGTVRTIRSLDDAKDLADERREQFRDVKP